jgi:hypothetical protein
MAKLTMLLCARLYRITIDIAGAICALAFAAAATPASAGNYGFLSSNGTGSACTQAAPCGAMPTALSAAGASGEVICLDKGAYGGVTNSQSVTISCGDGWWEAVAGQVTINAPAGSDVVIEGLVLDGLGSNASNIQMTGA